MYIRYLFQLIEQQRYGGGLMAPLGNASASTTNGAALGAGESLCTMSSSFMQQVDFTQSTLQRDLDSVDETKNFRNGEPADLETPRSSSLAERSKTFTDDEPLGLEMPRATTSSSSLLIAGTANDTTILKHDDSDGGYVTTNEFFPSVEIKARRVYSESALPTIATSKSLADMKK